MIPVYNTGRLLRRMVDSVLGQTLKDLELICVDDGSTDGSDAVLAEYAAKDQRVKVLRRKNGGPYAARSAGLAEARGDYVYLCDHDDFLHPQLLEYCVWALKRHDAKIIVFRHENRTGQDDRSWEKLPEFEAAPLAALDPGSEKCTRAEYLSELGAVHIDQWAHVAERKLAQSIPCRENFNLGRTLALIREAGTWLSTPLALYFYNTGNPGSLIRKPPTLRNVDDLHGDMVEIVRRFGMEGAEGYEADVWDAVCGNFLIPNLKIMYNMLRRAKTTSREHWLHFAIMLDDLFRTWKVPLGKAKFRHRLAYRWIMWLYQPELSESRHALTLRIVRNREGYLKLADELLKEKDQSKIEERVERIVGYFGNRITGKFAFPEVETALLKLAETCGGECDAPVVPKSVLHVMTSCLALGGHTRVVERWIHRSFPDEIHSLAVISPSGEALPARLLENIEKRNGKVFLTGDEPGISGKAAKLREIASGFEKIVLHANPDDPVPVVAFGSEKFKRPVFLFNHADHVPGLGVSVADCFVELRTYGERISKAYRGARRCEVVPLPYDDTGSARARAGDRSELRRKLGLPQDAKIVVSAGSTYKFRPFLQYDYLEFAKRVMEREKNAIFVAIGPTRISGPFPYRKRFKTVGSVPHDTLMDYYRCADLVVDSIPFAGAFALLDAVSSGAPVLSMDKPGGQMDYLLGSKAYARNMDEFAERAVEMLKNPGKAEEINNDVAGRLTEETDPGKWYSHMRRVLDSADAHRVEAVSPANSGKTVEDDILLFIEANHLHLKIKCSFLSGLLGMASFWSGGRKRRRLVPLASAGFAPRLG